MVEITQTPTESEEGSAKLACTGCGTKQKIVTLPMLNNTDYEVIETPTEIDGETININCYTYHFTEIKADDLVFDLRENLNSYFTVGDTYCTLNGWNTKYPKATASVKDNVFTATLTGDVTFDLGDAGGIDLSIFDELKNKKDGKTYYYMVRGYVRKNEDRIYSDESKPIEIPMEYIEITP